MADKKVRIVIEADGKDAAAEVAKVARGLKDVESKAKSSAKSISVEFIKAAAVIQGVKAAFKFAMDGVKEFEKATGAQGFANFQRGIKDVQLQVGSVLSPAFDEMSKVFERNKDKILTATAQMTAGIVSLVKIAASTVKFLFNAVVTAIGQIPEFFIKVFASMLDTIAAAMSALPDQFVPDGWIAGLQEAAGGAREFAGFINDEFAASAQAGADALADMGSEGKKLAGILQGKNFTVSKVRAAGPKDKETNAEVFKAEAELRKIRADTAKVTYQDLIEMETDYQTRLTDEIKARGEENAMFYAKQATVYNVYKSSLLRSVAEEFGIKRAMLDQEQFAEQAVIQESVKNNQLKTVLLEALYQKYEAKKTAINREEDEKRFATEQALNRSRREVLEKFEEDSQAAEDRMNDLRIAAIANSFDREIEIARASYKEHEEALKESLSQKLITQAQYNEAIANATIITNSKIAAINQERADSALAAEQKQTNDFMSELQKRMDYAVAWSQSVISIAENVYEIKANLLEKEKIKAYRVAEAQGQTAAELANTKEEIDKKYAKKLRELKKKQQAWAIADAIIAGGVASMNAWSGSMKLGMPAGLILGIITQALILGLTATNVALIASQNYARGGVVPGDPRLGDVQRANLTAGEIVLNRNQQANLLMSMANGTRTTPSYQGGNVTVIIQGNADQAILDEALRKSRQQQQYEMKQLLRDMQYSGALRTTIA